MTKTQILILREPVWESIAKDVFSSVVLLGMVGIGLWVGSGALQWAGAIMWLIWLPLKSVSYFKDNKLSIEQARAKLDELERGE